MITAWRVDNFDHFFIHRVGTAISQVKAVLCVLPGSMIPSISPRRTQAMRCSAQVIHMVVHSRPGPSMIIYWTSPPPLAGSTAACVSFRSSTARKADPPVRSRGGPAERDAMSGRRRARVKPGSCAGGDGVRHSGTAVRTDVDAAVMSFQRRGWGIQVVSGESERAPGCRLKS